MSVVVSAVSPGLNAEMYEAVTSRVMPGDQLPDGCELHIGGPVDQGWARDHGVGVARSLRAVSRGEAASNDPRARRRRSRRLTRSTSWSRADPPAHRLSVVSARRYETLAVPRKE